MWYQVYHRVLCRRHIVGTIHIIYIQWFFPRSHQSFIVERTYFIYFPECFIRLATSGIVVAAENPLELSANTVFGLFRQTNLCFHQLAHTTFAPYSIHFKFAGFRMQINTSPCTVFSIQQLVLLRKFLSVFRNVSSIRAAPILNYIPVGSFTAVTGGDDTHRTCCRVHFANDFTAFLCKFTRQCTFIL